MNLVCWTHWKTWKHTVRDFAFVLYKTKKKLMRSCFCFCTVSSSFQSALSDIFIHPPDCLLLPLWNLHNSKLCIFHMIPPGTFPVASAAALTLFLLAQHADGCAGINVLWPAFPSSQNQVFKSAQVSHQRELEYEERRIIAKCRQRDSRCLNTMPEFVYFLFYCYACTSRLLLLTTYSRLSNPLWQDSWPW